MMNIRIIFLCMVTGLVPCFSNGQQQVPSSLLLPGLQVANWQMDKGLPVNSIITIAQTADGWLFFGTEEGLARFDGNGFSLINKSNLPGLKVNFISALAAGHDTCLWIGTEGDGLIRYKNNSCVKYNNSNGLSDDRIYTLFADAGDGLWIGTSGGGVNYLKNGKISRYDTTNGLSSNYIRSIVQDARGRVWIGTQHGLAVIEGGKIQNYLCKDGLSDDFIESLAVDKDQNLWIGTKGGGLNVFKQGKFIVYTTKNGLTDNSVTALCCDKAGMLWIGTNGGGIMRMMQEKFFPFTTKDGLSGDLIVTLFQDREGNMWAGSSGAGIDRIKIKSIQNISSKDGLSGDVILPVFEDHAGAVWLGIADKGLNRLENGKVQRYDRKNGLPDHLVLAIAEDHDQMLWIGTAGGGLTKMTDGKFVSYTTVNGLSSNVVIALCCDRSGAVWAGTTGGGINQFNNGKFSAFTTKEGLSHDNVTCILEDRKGTIWVGTNEGLNMITNNKIAVISQKNGLSDDYILSLYEDQNGNLWVGTAANGFNLIRNGKITQFTTKDGLINEVVLKILEDDFGYFWISCNNGIYKIKKQDLLDFADKKLKSIISVSYGRTDGMESIECNGGVSPAGCKTRNGRLLFPTMKGISVIDPNLLKNTFSCFSPIFIEEFLADGQVVDISKPLSIPSYSKRLEFRYAALNYTNPEKIKYRCMLVGFDKEWIECGTNRTTSYTNIPAGKYMFKVMAASESGQWNEAAPAALQFRMKPPFYQSLPFYLGVAGFILLLLFFVVYYFIGRFQRNRLMQLVAERTNELHQKMMAQEHSQNELQRMNTELVMAKEQAESGDRLKTAFMNNISHEIRTPLNGILGFSQLLSDPDLTDEEREQYSAIVKTSSGRLINTVTDYMDISLLASANMKVQKIIFAPGELVDLMDEIYNKFLQPCQTKNLTLTLQPLPKTGSLIIHSDHELLSKVLYHLVDNACKFTGYGMISFGFEIKNNVIEFFVKDTGAGIAAELQTTIFERFKQENESSTRVHEGSGLGLSIVKGIIELWGGRIWLESVKGEGSSFFFTLPVETAGADHPVHQETRIPVTGNPLILLAEDDSSASILVQFFLHKAGFDVLVVTDGRLAVEACQQEPMISMVLMDMKMPVLNGFEATKKIKSFRPRLPVIAITAFALSGDESRALAAGCDDYIAKPFNREVLLGKLKKYGLGN